MQKTKLIQLLRKFNEAEMKSFRDFAHSPFFNKNKNVSKLSSSLLDYYPDFDSKQLTEENIFLKMFPDEKFNYSRIKNISSDLYSLALKFLEQTGRTHFSFIDNIRLLIELRLRGQTSAFEKKLDALLEEVKNQEIEKEEKLYYLHLLACEELNREIIKKPLSTSEKVQKKLDSFIEYSLLSLLKTYIMMMHETQQSNVKYDLKLFEDIIKYTSRNQGKFDPIISIYYNIILLESTKDEKYFYSLRKTFYEGFSLLSKGDAYMANLYLGSYCAYRYNIYADTNYVLNAYDLLKFSYRNDLVVLGKLLYPDFCNYVKVFLRAGDAELAKEFINDWKEELPAEEKDNCLNYSHGLLAYWDKDLKKAIELISQINFQSFIMKLQVKILLIQLYYETGMHEQLRSAADAFRHFIVREKKITDIYRNSLQAMLKIINIMLEIFDSNEKKEKQFLKNKLNRSVKVMPANPFGIKLWVMEQAKIL